LGANPNIRAKQERTDWHRIVAFGPLADICDRLLRKGRQVYIEGRLTTRQYEAKGGSGKHAAAQAR
jgi:single-strand DNA-binding protein